MGNLIIQNKSTKITLEKRHIDDLGWDKNTVVEQKRVGKKIILTEVITIRKI